MSVSSKIPRFVPCLAAVAITLLDARAGAALETIPGDMKDVMHLDCTPTCLLCHTDEDGGKNDLNDFGVQMGVWGVTFPQGGVENVFGENGRIVMETGDADGDGVPDNDFDADGVNDRDEIIRNTDPRTQEAVGVCSDAVYGCSAQLAPGSTPRTSALGLVAGLGMAALLLRQLRRA